MSKAFFDRVTRIPTLFYFRVINSCSPATMALLERFGDQGRDGLSYIHLFREKNCQSISKISIISNCHASDTYVYNHGFPKSFRRVARTLLLSTGALNQVLKIMKSLKNTF